MNVHDVVLADQVSHELLPFRGGEVGCDDGYMRVVSVALPVNAYCFEACVGQSGGETCVPATYFDGACTFTFAFNFDLDSNDLVVGCFAGECRWCGW